MIDERYDSELKGSGPPVGWWGPYEPIMTHPSNLGRCVNATQYAEGCVRRNGSGERGDLKRVSA